MRSDRYVALLDALVEAQRAPRFTDAAFGPAERLLEPLQANWASLHRRIERSGKHPSEDALHRVRVHAKRCRYGAELLEPVIGKPARDGARAAAKLQSVLGERHDAIVFRTWLHDRAVESTNTAAAFAAGEFAGEELVGLRSTARDWRKAYKRFAAVREPSRWRR
jgi:hypothetical protein